MILQPSGIYSFIDHKHSYVWYLLDGQKMLADIAVSQSLTANAQSFFRQNLLSVLPMTHLLKRGEGLGLYLDGDEPYFRWKCELNASGLFRTLLMPFDFDDCPEKMTGLCRVSKLLPAPKKSYTSVIKINELPLNEVINQVLRESYQVDAFIQVSAMQDQSLMVLRLGGKPTISPKEYRLQHQLAITELIDLNWNQLSAEELGKKLPEPFEFVHHRPVEFSCPCHKERFMDSLLLSIGNDASRVHAELYNENKELFITCDYCKKNYIITEEDLFARSHMQ
jgi:molecular chaperone Hsp33